MKTTLLALALALALPGCGSAPNSSEREWRRGQCGQIIDTEARDKCLKQVDYEYGNR